jgi:hypothetical protein
VTAAMPVTRELRPKGVYIYKGYWTIAKLRLGSLCSNGAATRVILLKG